VISELQAKEIPDYFWEEAKFIADLLGPKLCDLHLLDGVTPLSHDNYEEMYLNNTWRAWVTLTGMDGIPSIQNAGNVIWKSTSAKLAIRLPPTVKQEEAEKVVKELLTKDPPYNSKITVEVNAWNGWAQNPLEPWLETSLNQASEWFFGPGQKCRSYGEGGSIPFLATLGGIYPKT